MTDSDTGRIKKTDQAQKIRTEICRIFFNRQMTFNALHLNHLQQVRCCCWCKVKNSESKSQQKKTDTVGVFCCCCWCKVKNSESKSQLRSTLSRFVVCCCCWCKVKNSESKSQLQDYDFYFAICCCCWCKVKNSESKSQLHLSYIYNISVVVAGVKLKILKANHNMAEATMFRP